MADRRDLLNAEHGQVVSKLLRDRAKIIDRHPGATPEQLDRYLQAARRREGGA